MIIRQSDLSSFSYCARQQHYNALGQQGGIEPRRLSATILGTHIHYALQIFQQLHHEGRGDAADVALATFEHYWHPERAHEISEGFPNDWVRGHTWALDLAQGKKGLQAAFEWIKRDKFVLLGIEHTFDVPFELDGEQHTLHGTVDRLGVRFRYGIPFLAIDDWKTGIKPDYLQYANQWTTYGFASLQPAFWQDFTAMPEFFDLVDRVEGKGLTFFGGGAEDLPVMEREGRWLAVRNGEFKAHNAGPRGEWHYRRLMVHIRDYIRAQRAGVHPLTTDTKKCMFCPWLEVCGQAPLPDFQEGLE